jgi:uncharacterized protein with PIN domain
MSQKETFVKFLCDEMLTGLGRWLRIAGYDTLIIETIMNDQEILHLALQENRLLLTRDRHFLNMGSQDSVIYLNSNTMEECVAELTKKLKINWLFSQFSRCIVCNTPFIEADPQLILEQAPPDVQNSSTKFWYCPNCQKLFWEGSHTERMYKQLQKWQNSNNKI